MFTYTQPYQQQVSICDSIISQSSFEDTFEADVPVQGISLKLAVLLLSGPRANNLGKLLKMRNSKLIVTAG